MARSYHCSGDVKSSSPQNGLCPAGPKEAQVPVCSRSLAQDPPEPDKPLQLPCRCFACRRQLPYDQKSGLRLIVFRRRQCRSCWTPHRLSQDRNLACKARLYLRNSGSLNRGWRPLVADKSDFQRSASWPSSAHRICTPDHYPSCMSGRSPEHLSHASESSCCLSENAGQLHYSAHTQSALCGAKNVMPICLEHPR